MAENKGTQTELPDPAEISATMASIAERSQRIVAEFLARQGNTGSADPAALDPLNIGSAFMEMTSRMMSNPGKMVEAQMSLWQDYMDLWQSTARRMMGESSGDLIEPDRDDRRFRDEMWNENEVFDYIKQSYLLSARWIQDVVRDVDGLDDKTAAKVDFYTRQFVDALAPTNFVLTNPEVLRTTLESGGENLINGLNNLLSDLEDGKGKLRIRMTDQDAFDVGKNIAVTPGKVVFQNDLMQLIQYTPTTEKVAKTPLMIIPPWINKFYILDLREKNSFIKWAVGEGHTVFVVSWVNPDGSLRDKSFEDYMLEGPIAGLEAVEKATGVKKINVIGYCLGGTLLASALSYMKTKKIDRVASATFFTTMVDFSEAGELGVFIDETQLAHLEKKMDERGFLEGSEMATTFNMLRANDLIWSFVVNNYLLGKEPFPFDLLYWNSDSTRMPAAMHSFYLRRMYQENKLVEPGGIELCGVPIDLTSIELPAYIISTREDHIAPWKSTYAATQLYKGPTRFVLAGSGHIAGIVNPPAANKYGYWTNNRKAKSPDTWFKGATQHEGSWWNDWNEWVGKFAGGQVDARIPGDGKLKVIEDAPGSYVKVRATDGDGKS
ncbi:class I poly(R)-hydroxyalkanoic acid synthase [Alphaproteobacteria bacterium HT1-32]|nr:class I poly(R)-hydroxyalkanoic acid synthase [Alphaproteobacteria bacterium HT1-32]